MGEDGKEEDGEELTLLGFTLLMMDDLNGVG
jgi:hypothetical protein